MDIWIIQDGEKIGPIHDFDVRKKIEHGELPATTPAWHDGLPAWKPLIEIGLFEREFERPGETRDTAPVFPPEDADVPPLPPLLPEPSILFRRFWARWFDLFLFAGLWWIAMWAAGRDIESLLNNPWMMLFQYVPWFVLEALFLHRFATTPGKWLLGIRIVNSNGTFLDLAAASRRAARVLFIGIGFGFGPIALVCQTLAFFNAKHLGRPLWDHAGGHRVTAEPLNPLRLTAYVLLFFTALQLQAIVVVPYVFEAAGKKFPALKEQYDKNPPWHLPKNS